MAGQLEGKVAVITGSGRGQGLAAALLFAQEGAKVVINDLDQETVDAAVSQVTEAGGQAASAPGDVSDAEAVQSVLKVAKDTFGGIDILYNNAGVGYSATTRLDIGMSDLVSTSLEDWRRVIDINLGSIFLFCKFGIPMLAERGGGVIINTASIAALRGSRNAHAYGASKGAIVQLTKSIAITYGSQGIRANAICPGVIDTEMIRDTMLASDAATDAIRSRTPVGEIGTSEDIATTALFLASDASKFISGQAIVVDGGLTA